MQRLIFAILALALGAAEPGAKTAAAQNDDRLTIGITQFPANLQPNIESMMA